MQKELCDLLKKEREELGLTLKSVSKKIGFNNYQTLSSIEAGEREIKGSLSCLPCALCLVIKESVTLDSY